MNFVGAQTQKHTTSWTRLPTRLDHMNEDPDYWCCRSCDLRFSKVAELDLHCIETHGRRTAFPLFLDGPRWAQPHSAPVSESEPFLAVTEKTTV